MSKLMKLDPYIGNKSEYNIIYTRKTAINDSPTKVQMNSNSVMNKPKRIFRKKFIIIEDSCKQIAGSFYNKSKVLSCRNPFRPDSNVIDYNMDSEDELEEANGEDIADEQNNKSEDDEEDMAEQEEAKGFIVEDDYLSVSELNYSNASNQMSDE